MMHRGVPLKRRWRILWSGVCLDKAGGQRALVGGVEGDGCGWERREGAMIYIQ